MVKARTWSKKIVERSQRTVARLIDAHCSLDDKPGRVAFAIGQVVLLASEDKPLKEILRFFFCVEALKLDEDVGSLSAADAEELRRVAREILARAAIDPSSSQLSFLHGTIASTESRELAKEGRRWQAVWRQVNAIKLSRRSDTRDLGLVRDELASLCLSLGYPTYASTIGIPASPARIARLTGDRNQAQTKARGSPADASQSWEAHVAHACESGDFRALTRLIRRDGPNYAPREILHCVLYTLACKAILDDHIRPNLETIVRRRDVAWGIHQPLLKAVRRLLTLIAGKTPESGASELVASVEGFADPEDRLLLYAAIARWLARRQSFPLAALVAREYRTLSWRLSDGRDGDVLLLLGDMYTRPWFEDWSWQKAGSNAS